MHVTCYALQIWSPAHRSQRIFFFFYKFVYVLLLSSDSQASVKKNTQSRPTPDAPSPWSCHFDIGYGGHEVEKFHALIVMQGLFWFIDMGSELYCCATVDQLSTYKSFKTFIFNNILYAVWKSSLLKSVKNSKKKKIPHAIFIQVLIIQWVISPSDWK